MLIDSYPVEDVFAGSSAILMTSRMGHLPHEMESCTCYAFEKSRKESERECLFISHFQKALLWLKHPLPASAVHIDALKGKSMRVEPPFHFLGIRDFGKARNILTTIGLVSLLLFTAINVLSTAYETSFSLARENVSRGFQSGLLYFDGEGAFLLAVLFFFPLGLWNLVSFLLALRAYQKKKPYAKRSTIIWASILFGVILLVFVGLFAAGSLPCVDEYHCALPLRPGIAIPTALP